MDCMVVPGKDEEGSLDGRIQTILIHVRMAALEEGQAGKGRVHGVERPLGRHSDQVLALQVSDPRQLCRYALALLGQLRPLRLEFGLP